MKSILKKVALASLVSMTLLTFASCGSNSNNQNKEAVNNKTNQEQKEEKNETWSKELAKFINDVEGTVFKYSGFAEFRKDTTVSEVNESSEEKTITFKNEYMDMSEGESGKSKEDLLSETKYTIKEDSIIEQVYEDTKSPSIITESIILKGELKKDSSWEQEVVINGKKHQAVTSIKEINTDESGRTIVITETAVEGVEGYGSETYLEKRVYTEGIGLTEFSCNYLLSEGSTMEFGYRIFENGNR
ncbi:hypothetical protein [Oceanirhabdus sp. W0125-5]|uniref:hypothetical protein n=1 Tax=Oceanirhabdus sp. W0125-5 TaxID=2999116 RepID=UPI0022F2D2F7|nr:hypothetical protein [Oceanirhabdus sp. W0125-5]WBW96987.1 hypothetical protein OW730_25350 [Oceanirhabdus sp. W0125-5]